MGWTNRIRMDILIALYKIIHYQIHSNVREYFVIISTNVFIISILVSILWALLFLIYTYFTLTFKNFFNLFTLIKNHINILNKTILEFFKIIKTHLYLILFSIFGVLLTLAIIYLDPTNKYSFDKISIYENTVVKDANLEVLDYIFTDEIRIWKDLNSIDSKLTSLVLFSEDDKFYDHKGIDIYEISNSIKKNIKAKKYKRGASTITQQLVKNLFLTKEKTIKRKLIELVLSFKIEEKLSKKDIIEYYMNIIEWGPGIYGAEAASRYYFDKSSKDLDINEAIFLALIIPNPNFYSPFYKPENMDLVLAKHKLLVNRLYKEKHINYEQKLNIKKSFNLYKNRDTTNIVHLYPKLDNINKDKNYYLADLEKYLEKKLSDIYVFKYEVLLSIDKNKQLEINSIAAKINKLFPKQSSKRFLTILGDNKKIIAIAELNTINALVINKIEAALFAKEKVGNSVNDIPWDKIVLKIKKEKTRTLESKT